MGRSLNPLPKGKRVARESDRRRSGCLLAALLLLLTAVQVATKAEVGGGVIDRAGLPPLRVGMDPSFVPFEFYTGPDTPAQGYDVDLAREIARRLGQEVVIVIEGPALDADQEMQLLWSLGQELPRYHAPRRLHYLPAFTETSTGKIDRNRSLAQLAGD